MELGKFWLIQGVFAWLVFPLLGALLGIPQGGSLFDLWGAGGAPMSIFMVYYGEWAALPLVFPCVIWE